MAAALADAGLADSYDAARREVEAARAEVAATAAAAAAAAAAAVGDELIGPPV